MSEPLIPPHDLMLERAILGSVLLDPRALDQLDDVRVEDFFSTAHQVTFAAMRAVAGRGQPIDAVTLRAELTATKQLAQAGGVEGLVRLTDDLPLAANVRGHASVLRSLAIRRGVILAAWDAAALARNPVDEDGEALTPEAFAERVEQGISSALARSVTDRAKPISEIAHAWYQEHKRARETGVKPGKRCGIGSLDHYLAGFRGGELYVVAGRPGMGKSALAQAIGIGIAEHTRETVLIQSLEMASEQWLMREVSSRSSVSGSSLRNATETKDEQALVVHATGAIGTLPVWIDDTPGVSLLKVRSEARRLRARGPLGCVVVDYLQLMSSTTRSTVREQVISEISRGLKALAKELDTPVIALSQLSRECEKRADKRPMQSDLRESGAIEQDADVILFLYRDEVYNPKSADVGVAEVIVGKFRGGATGTVRLAWDGQFTRFTSIERDHDDWSEAAQ